MRFEIGKFYKHTTGMCLSILCEQETMMYGKALLAEQTLVGQPFIAVGSDEDSAVNFHASIMVMRLLVMLQSGLRVGKKMKE
jgi:hypothetical protein